MQNAVDGLDRFPRLILQRAHGEAAFKHERNCARYEGHKARYSGRRRESYNAVESNRPEVIVQNRARDGRHGRHREDAGREIKPRHGLRDQPHPFLREHEFVRRRLLASGAFGAFEISHEIPRPVDGPAEAIGGAEKEKRCRICQQSGSADI